MYLDHSSLVSVGADLACAPAQEWSLGEALDPAYPWKESCAYDALEELYPSRQGPKSSADELACLANV